MKFAERRAERKVFRELHHQLKVSYKVNQQATLPANLSPETNKIYFTDALNLRFHLDTCVLEIYDVPNKTQLFSIDCIWNACDADQKRKNKAFYKLYHYAIQREREPNKTPKSSPKTDRFIKNARVQELYVGLHKIKGAYAKAWRDGKSRSSY